MMRIIDTCIYCCENKITPGMAVCDTCFEKMDTYDQESCTKVREKGEADLYFLTDKLDEIFCSIENEEESLLFHQWRVRCINECLDYANPELFSPRTEEEVNKFRKIALDYWEGKINEKDRRQADKEISEGKWRDSGIFTPQYELQTVIGGMIDGPEGWDWGWYQYMELNIGGLEVAGIDPNILIKMLYKYFEAELRIPIDISE